MPTYRAFAFEDGTEPGDPPGENVLAHKVATKWSVHQQFRAQDRLIGSGRRILLEVGLDGANDFAWPGGNPATASTNPDYPDADTAYPVARGKDLQITPGSLLRLHVLAARSGETQQGTGGAWASDSAQGYVKIAVTYENEDAATETVTREVPIAASVEQYSAEPGDESEHWSQLVTEGADVVPEDFDLDIAITAKWTTPEIKCDVTMSYRGSPRIIHAFVYEKPMTAARDISKSNWPTHLYTQAFAPLKTYPSDYPLENNTTSDPALGTNHAINTATESAEQLGPAIVSWTSWAEHVETVLSVFSTASHGGNNANGTGDNEGTALTTTSTTFDHWQDSNIATFDATAPGLSLGCGAYGRLYRLDEDDLILPNTGVIPVLISVYVKLGDVGADQPVIRFQTEDYSYIDINVPTGTTSWTWLQAVGELYCGTGPEDDATLQVFWHTDSGGQTLSMRAFHIHHRKDPPA